MIDDEYYMYHISYNSSMVKLCTQSYSSRIIHNKMC